ncbi:uncharacterized protein LOC133201303 [Saccostrea echinata]|uniref:uncharacterized protein LOC133201303 n=1 Tax=Saccostrea echinata TaxID=191078 RepID=UPI002A826DE6|nr:uncharacterized protein LOC133201303 [Saccostrea echinata]
MSGHFFPVLTLLCSACGVLAMCSMKRYPLTVEEWYNCVPCPPLGKFSLLCSQLSKDCELLTKLLEICLSQYNQYYKQWFTDDIKCSEKQACLKKHKSVCLPLGSIFEVLNVSCRQRTDSTTTTLSSTTTTPHLTTSTTLFSTTHVRTTQTTNDHVTNFTQSITSSFIEVINTTVLTSAVTPIPQEPPRMEPISSHLIFIIIGVIVIVFAVIAAVVFAIWKVKEMYYVNFESPLYRQTSTDSRAAIIRTENDCNILCVFLKHRVTSQDNGHLTSKEIQKGYYNAVPGGEYQTDTVFQNNEMFEEDVSIKANCDDEICNKYVINDNEICNEYVINDVDQDTRL